MPVALPPDLMVGVSGFRGRVGSVFTPELVSSLAAAFGAFLREDSTGSDTVFLGRDSRTSGSMFADAARSGLVSVGCDVVDMGVVSTPTLLLAAEDADAVGALGVTASHNPAEWNALKFAGENGIFLDAERMGRFREWLASNGSIPRAPWDALGRASEDLDGVGRHVNRILELPHVDVERLRSRRFRVAIDCVRGAGGEILSQLLEDLGCQVWGIGLDADGRFPRDPEPTPENLSDLGDLVRDTGAEFGLAVDPDVDRLSLVDGRGNPVGEDLTLALCADVVLGRSKGPVVTNLSTSQVVDDVARAAGVPCIRAPVGEINVSRRMEKVGAAIGGEGNGGVILPQLHLTRDAPLGVALILQHLLERDASLREAVDRWPVYHIVKAKVAFSRESIGDAYRTLSRELDPPLSDSQDGLRMAWPDAGEWLHVRPSGTEPVVRFIAEARTRKKAKALVAQAREILGA